MYFVPRFKHSCTFGDNLLFKMPPNIVLSSVPRIKKLDVHDRHSVCGTQVLSGVIHSAVVSAGSVNP